MKRFLGFILVISVMCATCANLRAYSIFGAGLAGVVRDNFVTQSSECSLGFLSNGFNRIFCCNQQPSMLGLGRLRECWLWKDIKWLLFLLRLRRRIESYGLLFKRHKILIGSVLVVSAVWYPVNLVMKKLYKREKENAVTMSCDENIEAKIIL